MAQVVVVGAVNVDMVVVAPVLPGPGRTVVGDGLRQFGGGKGANAAVAAARAGAEVRYVGAVGADDLGRGALDELRAEGVRTGSVAVLEDVSTGVALIVVDERGENQIAVGAGANAAVEAGAVRTAVRGSGAACVLVSTEIPADAVAAAVEEAAALGVRCVLNPAPVIPVVADLLAHGPLLTPNAGELADLTALLVAADLAGNAAVADLAGDAAADLAGDAAVGDADADADAVDAAGDRRVVAARAVALAARTGAPVVVTLGGDGVLVVEPDGEPQHVPARPADVRDTTGAGDTFNGVLAAGLAAGEELGPAVRRAVVAAALSVTEPGARGGMPTAAAIEAALGAAD